MLAGGDETPSNYLSAAIASVRGRIIDPALFEQCLIAFSGVSALLSWDAGAVEQGHMLICCSNDPCKLVTTNLFFALGGRERVPYHKMVFRSCHENVNERQVFLRAPRTSVHRRFQIYEDIHLGRQSWRISW